MRIRTTIAIAASAALIAGAASCRQEGPAEKLGQQIDDTTDQVRKNIEDATDQARENIDDATDKAKKKFASD